MATYEPILDEVLVHTHPGEDITGGNVGGAVPIRSVSFATNSSLPADVGQLKWNATDGTLDLGLAGGNVKLQIGQEQVIRVVNKTGADLLESQYKVVRARRTSEGGAQGQRVAVLYAQANQEISSNDIIGVVTENITNNQEGFITVQGQVKEINTTGSLQGETWSDGDLLFLSPSISGGLTNVEPQAPDHLVIIGYVEYAHAQHGKILVQVRNSWELDELHNVRIASASLATNQLLAYMPFNASISLWQNVNIANLSLTISPTFNPANTSSVNLIYSAPTLSATVIPSGIPHNSLASLQGGTINEFFHLSGSLASIASRQANASLSGFLSFEDWYNFSNLISFPTLPLVVADSSSIDLAYGFPTLTASILPGGVIHNSLASLQGGTTNEYFHLSGTLASIAKQQANSSLPGYLSGADFRTFSNLISSPTLTLTVTDTATIDFTLTGNNLFGQVLLTGIPHGSLASLQGGVIGEYFHLSSTLATIASRQANGSLSGFLSGADWTTFNAKQQAITVANTSSVNLSLSGATLTATVLGSGIVHGSLASLGIDDHTQYALLSGRSGGQTLSGGTAASNNLTLSSTANATKGNIVFGTSAYSEANNRLGIATTNPYAPLTIGSTGQVFAIENAAWFVAKNNTGAPENYLWPRWTDNVTYLNFGSGGFNIRNSSGTPVMFMQNGGNVGIGTTAPRSLLEVYQAANGALGGNIVLSNSGSVGGATAVIFSDGTGNDYRAAITVTTEGSPNFFGNIQFKTGWGAYASLTTRTIITGAGNVGIGTTAPGDTLQVNGGVTVGYATGVPTNTNGMVIAGKVNIGNDTVVTTSISVGSGIPPGAGLTLSDSKNMQFGTTTGTKIGTGTTQKIAFYNATPIVQPASANQAAVAVTGATQTTPWGYTTAAQANAIVTLVNEIRTTLVNLGLMKGSA